MDDVDADGVGVDNVGVDVAAVVTVRQKVYLPIPEVASGR